VPVKGVDTLLRAVQRVQSHHTGVRLYLVGDGPLRKQLEATTLRLGIKDCVCFAGSVPHAALAHWYRAADYTVLSSDSEGIPNVLLESHACGTPFVATAVGGVPEIAIPGVDHLVPSGNATELADSLNQRSRAGAREGRRCPTVSSTSVRRRSGSCKSSLAAQTSGNENPQP
jgi:glycosyltransferase involved in cell wall biosynthesis